MIRTVNPATGELLRSFEPLSARDLDERLSRAWQAARDYQRTSFADRAAILRSAADILEGEKEAFGELMVTEMGKPLGAAVAEAQKCAWACRYYADGGERMLAREVIPVEDGEGWVTFEPLGVVLAVMPWNFPFWQVFRFAAPALMAGNVGILKHASNVPQCALAIEDVFRRAGLLDGTFQTLLVGSDVVESIIADRRVAAVTLTGSEGAGKAVAAAAGRSLKKSVVELGGSDPFLVMPSADLSAAAATAVQARMINNGQSCIAAKRFIVHQDIAKEFERRFVDGVKALRVGDPMDPATNIGPLATADILRDLDKQVRTSVSMGARVLIGGHPLDQPGNYYAPTVLVEIPPDAPVARDEVFGPVAPIIEARDLDEAIGIANGTSFGLAAAAWTTDPSEQERCARELECGTVFLNGMVASDPRFPFGGVKRSGYGRELGVFGIREFVNIKTLRVVQEERVHQDRSRHVTE